MNHQKAYSILGVSSSTSEEDLKKQYKKLSLKYHPDKNPDNHEEAEAKFKEISEAYQFLTQPQSQGLGHGHGNGHPFHAMDPFELFRQFHNMGPMGMGNMGGGIHFSTHIGGMGMGGMGGVNIVQVGGGSGRGVSSKQVINTVENGQRVRKTIVTQNGQTQVTVERFS